jgi:lipoprotein signal peptidase
MQPTSQRPYLALFVVLAALGFVADQASKYGIFTYLYTEELRPDPPHINVVTGVFRLEASHTHVRPDWTLTVHRDPGGPLSFLRTISGECLPHVNRGALFGIGNSADGGGMNHVFALISIVAAIFILIWAARPPVAQDWLMSMALGLILGGTLGNLYDRLVFSGVRDFLHWYYWYDWPVFNIADCCLVCGAAVLMVHSFFVADKTTEPAANESGTPGTSVVVAESAFTDKPYPSSQTGMTPAAPVSVQATSPTDGT